MGTFTFDGLAVNYLDEGAGDQIEVVRAAGHVSNLENPERLAPVLESRGCNNRHFGAPKRPGGWPT